MQICNYKDIDEGFFSKIEFESISSVQEIISAVRKDGDSAIREYAKKFGDGELQAFKLTEEEIEDAFSKVDAKTIETIKFAIQNVREFAQSQLNSVREIEVNINGNTLGQKIICVDIWNPRQPVLVMINI